MPLNTIFPEHTGHPLFRLPLFLGVAAHSYPHFEHFHHTFVCVPDETLLGSKFLFFS